MRSFFIFFAATAAIGFGFGVVASNSATRAADRVIEAQAERYCEAGITEFCS